MQARPSHSALDELLDVPLGQGGAALFSGAELITVGFTGDHALHGGARRDTNSSACASAAIWLPAPDACIGSKQQDIHTTAIRQRAWPHPTSAIAWVGNLAAAGVSIQADNAVEDRRQPYATAAPASASAHGRKPKAAWRPCYQSVLKVCQCLYNSHSCWQHPAVAQWLLTDTGFTVEPCHGIWHKMRPC